MKTLLKSLLNGHPYNQEYLCLAENSLSSEAFLSDGKNNIQHLFIGYKPAIIATIDEFSHLYIKQPKITGHINLGELAFSPVSEYFKTRPDIKIHTGNKAHSYIIKGWRKKIADWGHKRKNNPNDPLYLNDDLYNQVRLLYSIPRKISLISIGHEELFNVCPTDLHGSFDNRHYIISLRKNGKIRNQIEKIKKILLADIDSAYYKEVYLLGKNHMQDLKPISEHLSLSLEKSEHYKLPIPKGAVEYKELEFVEHIPLGIHDLLLFSIKNKVMMASGKKLMHIHSYYGGWRKKNHFNDEYLFR